MSSDLGASALVVAVVPAVPLVVLAAAVEGAALTVGWLALQHRTLTLRPGQPGATKAAVSAFEMTGFALPVAFAAAADTLGIRIGLALFAVPAFGLVALAGGLGDRPRRRYRHPVRLAAVRRRTSP